MRRYLRLRAAADAAPQWASQLTVRNTFTFVIILGLAWFTPLIKDGKTTALQVHRIQQILFLTAAVMALTFVVRTVHDVRRHRMAKILLANPDYFRAAMVNHAWQGLMIVTSTKVSFVRPAAYNTLASYERYWLAKEFLNYLAGTDKRWWKPINLRRTVDRALAVAYKRMLTIVALVTPILLLAVPFQLIQMADTCQRRRYLRRTFLP